MYVNQIRKCHATNIHTKHDQILHTFKIFQLTPLQ